MGHGDDLAADGRLSGVTAGVEVIAHRGANREARENTLPAFQRALEIGVHGIELDVQLTADGIPVVHHDADVADSAGDFVPISSLTVNRFRTLSGCPTLDEVLALVAGRCRLYIEIKAAPSLEAVVSRVTPHREWCAIHSFDHRVVARAGILNPEISTGILLASYLVETGTAMLAASARDVWQLASFVDRALIDEVHDAGGRVVAWTVNDVARMNELVALGVDAVCTDTPRELIAVMRRTTP